MPKYRQLHLKILDSIDVNEMPDDFTRLTWVLLSLIVDSEGRGLDNPAWVRSKMYPLREDVELSQISAAMDYFSSRRMIILYSAEGRKYFYIPTWALYQSGTDREGKSSIPTPDLLRSNSGVAPDELPPNQPMQLTTNTKQGELTSNSALSSPPESDPYAQMQSMIERLTGYPATQRDIVPTTEFIKRGVIEEDIVSAIAFLNSVEKVPRGAADMKGSVMTAVGKRTQARISSATLPVHQITEEELRRSIQI
jgi:hypothetical protein